MKARKLTKQEAFDLVLNVPAFATYDYHINGETWWLIVCMN